MSVAYDPAASNHSGKRAVLSGCIRTSRSSSRLGKQFAICSISRGMEATAPRNGRYISWLTFFTTKENPGRNKDLSTDCLLGRGVAIGRSGAGRQAAMKNICHETVLLFCCRRRLLCCNFHLDLTLVS